jgi:hypothetical protein
MKNELKTLGDVKKILAKAELAKELLQHLSQEDTEKAVKFLLDEGISFEKKSAYLGKEDLSIQVHSDPIEFGNAATLKQSSFHHSWAGSDETKSLGWVVIGDVEFGESTFSQYSQNGDTRSPNESYEAPEFSLDQKQVILVRVQEDDTFNNRDDHSVTYYLHIYQPSEYLLPDWVTELTERFGW